MEIEKQIPNCISDVKSQYDIKKFNKQFYLKILRL